MKTLQLVIFCTLLSFSAVGQNVTIPDANFKGALLADNSINTVDDGEISVAEAEAFTGTIDVSNQDIDDLTGIEAFINITNLYCPGNNLTSMDVSMNTKLKLLFFNANPITSIDLSTNLELVNVRCQNTSLTALDLSNNSEVFNLWCFNCNISSLDLSGNPDLIQLLCYGNALTALDLSNKSALKFLDCGDNLLTSLNVTNSTLLEQLECYENQLTSIDLSTNAALTQLDFSNNALTTIDVSNSPDLTEFYGQFNQLTTINITNGNNTNIPNGQFDATDNPNLSCVQVDDVTYSENNWTNVDDGATFSLDCGLGNSISDVDILEGNLYPNPATSTLFIESRINTQYKLQNIFGQTLHEETLHSGLNRIDVEGLQEGIYLIVPENAIAHRFMKH